MLKYTDLRRGINIGGSSWLCTKERLWRLHPSIYSIAETAKVNNLESYDYFVYFLEEVPKHMKQKDRPFLEDLLLWSKKLSEGIRKQQ